VADGIAMTSAIARCGDILQIEAGDHSLRRCARRPMA